MAIQLHVSDLSSPCITRARGQLAAERLLSYLTTDSVEIDLNDVEMLSTSFLDGLVSHLPAQDIKNKVTFLVNDPIVKNKLARVAAVRHIDLYYCSHNNKRRTVNWKSPSSLKAVFADTKMLL